MNASTLLKLKNNPHYKMSEKQEAELEQKRRKPMIAIGRVPRHPVAEIERVRKDDDLIE